MTKIASIKKKIKKKICPLCLGVRTHWLVVAGRHQQYHTGGLVFWLVPLGLQGQVGCVFWGWGAGEASIIGDPMVW